MADDPNPVETAILLEAGSKLIDQLHKENLQLRTEGAKIVHALDCSTQLIEALLAWLPEGLVLSEQVKSTHGAWRAAMQKIMQ